MISLIHGLGLSLQTGDSDELIIPLSCNYTPVPPPSFSLSPSLLFPSQSLLSFVYCSPLLIQSLFISVSQVHLALSRTHTRLDISVLFLLCIYYSLYTWNLLTLSFAALLRKFWQIKRMRIQHVRPMVYMDIGYKIPHPVTQSCRCVLYGTVFTSGRTAHFYIVVKRKKD